MSEAPERIWIEDEFGDGDDDQWTYGTWDVRNYMGYDVEYVRADLALPAVQPDAVSRDAVMQALQEWTYCCDAEEVVRAIPAVQPDAAPVGNLTARGNAATWALYDANLTRMGALQPDPLCECGMTGPCKWTECKAPILSAHVNETPKSEHVPGDVLTPATKGGAEPTDAQPDLTDPNVVHANMLRGTIAKPTLEQIRHLYGDAVQIKMTMQDEAEAQLRWIAATKGGDA